MPRTSPPAPAESEAESHSSREDRQVRAIRLMVLRKLGRPDDLRRISIHPLFLDHFRINVYREIDDRLKITDSFFVFVTADGMVSNPPINLRYPPLEPCELPIPTDIGIS